MPRPRAIRGASSTPDGSRIMDKENSINLAGVLCLAQFVIPMSEGTRIVLTLALAALLGRAVWLLVTPTWAKYPATVGALTALALIVVAR